MILRTASDEVAKWAGYQLGTEFVPPFIAWGILDRKGKLIGAVIFNDHADRNVEITTCGIRVYWRGVFREVFRYAFDDLNCERTTVRTRSDNEIVKTFIRKIGFTQEGVLRKWYGDADAIVYGMLKSECKWR